MKPLDPGQDAGRPPPGDSGPAGELMPLVYAKLRSLAAKYMREERGYRTLQPTALVHEAWLRMERMERIDWKGKTHFFAMAATTMRRILVEQARAAGSRKRGERPARVELTEGLAAVPEFSADLLALDQALERLGARSARQARVAELRLFAGMEMAEIAEIVGVSDRTVRADWKVARAWLGRELSASAAGGA
jgi:RNA polymerase sigma factor (TIGR02999 family)